MMNDLSLVMQACNLQPPPRIDCVFMKRCSTRVKRRPIEQFSSELCAKQQNMKIGRWWKFLFYNMDNLTAKNVPSGVRRGLCGNRTGLRAVYRELWAMYCLRVVGPWTEGVCGISWYLHIFGEFFKWLRGR